MIVARSEKQAIVRASGFAQEARFKPGRGGVCRDRSLRVRAVESYQIKCRLSPPGLTQAAAQ